MTGLPTVKPKEVIKILKILGFYVHHQSGSHIVMRHMFDSSRRVTIPMHNKDMKKGTLHNILKQAGISAEEFVENL
mgnify:CR=1 FL=1